MNISQLIIDNQNRWDQCKLISTRIPAIMSVAARLVAPMARARYLAVEEVTTVPWFVIAVTHEREASQDWHTQLAQGDRLDRVSVNVPRGRGPFLFHEGDVPGADAWHRAALDAMIDCAPHLAAWRDWSPGGLLTALQAYNGFGYHGPSPYVWGATDQQVRGKYVRDGVYDPMAWDTQLGCAAMLKGIMQLDPSITFPTKE